jgi:superfamily I DNA and/or RNA helicase
MLKNLNVEDFKNLLSYYIKCIEREDMMSLTYNFKTDGEKFYSSFFLKEEFFFERKERVSLKKTKEIELFLKEYKLVEKSKSLFYGYPIIMDTTGKISPIFFIEIFYDEVDDKILFTKSEPNPEFNHYILQKENFSFEEIEKIRMELDEEDSFISKLDRITNLLGLDKKNILSVLSVEKLELKPYTQIVNKAILYSGERTGIVYNLLSELNNLQKQTKQAISSSSISYFFSDIPNDVNSHIEHPIIEIFPMNASQERAVHNALQKELSVITGPPGTGKSQVVLNIIANAVINNKTVLFASKNNKAVDVVFKKFDTILAINPMIRMGSREYRRSARDRLEDLMIERKTFIQGEIPENCLPELKKINQQIDSIKSTIALMTEINNSIDALYCKMNNYLKELPEELIKRISDESFDAIDQFRLELDIQKLINDNRRILIKILKILFPNWYNKRLYTLFEWYLTKLPKSFKDYVTNSTHLQKEEVIRILQLLLYCKKIENVSKQITEKKYELTKMPSLIEMNEQLTVLQKQRLYYSIPLFENHLLLKLKNLQINQENHISRYFDASEKLEKYIDNTNLWIQLNSDKKTQMCELLKFIPVWVVTNLSVRNSIPFENSLFDILIIDEASQCDIASALPLIYRAKQIVIIGDPKQLKHISLLKESQDKEYASDYHIEKYYLDYSYSKNSLYDLSERIIKEKQENPIFLADHYRSHIDIITFSNEHFYDNRLNVLTNTDTLISDDLLEKRVSWEDIEGRTVHSRSPYCIEEANYVVDKIIRLLELFKGMNADHISFGVVTLFRAQMELIQEKINKSDRLKDMDITVGTAHRFQGDEKDIIIFSPAVSDGTRSTTINWIRSTNQLLNVAVTRARSGLVIVGNKKKCLEAEGILQDLVEYSDTKHSSEVLFDSNIEKILYDHLIQNKVKVRPQYWTKVKDKKSYRLDFALFVNGQKYDIEIDGDKAHSQRVENDILRDIHLQMEGWKIRRYRANQIQNDIDNVIQEIKRLC